MGYLCYGNTRLLRASYIGGPVAFAIHDATHWIQGQGAQEPMQGNPPWGQVTDQGLKRVSDGELWYDAY